MHLRRSFHDYAGIPPTPRPSATEPDPPDAPPEPTGSRTGAAPSAPSCVIVLGSDAPPSAQQIVRHVDSADERRTVRHTVCRPQDPATDYSVLRRLFDVADGTWPWTGEQTAPDVELIAEFSAEQLLVLVIGEAQWCDRGTMRWIDRLMYQTADTPPRVLMASSHRALTTADAAFHEIMSRDYCTVVDAADFLAARAAGPDLESLARLEPHLLRVVQAAAVLRSTDADLVGALAGLPPRLIARTLHGARESGLLTEPMPPAGLPDRLEAMVALSGAEAERMHARAAEILSDAARPAEQVADHLLARSELDSPWMISILREAAAATRGEHPAAAVRYLSRLHEIDPDDDATSVELGTAMLEIDPARARRHLGHALARAGAADTGFEKRTVDETVTGADAAAAAQLAAVMTRQVPDTPRALADLLRQVPGDSASGRELVPAARALRMALAGTSMEDAVYHAEQVLGAERRVGAWATVAAAQTLGLADHTPTALAHLASAAADARRREEPWAECHVRSARAQLLLESGALVEAAAEAAAAVRIAEGRGWTAEARLPLTTLAHVMLCRAELDRAEETLRRIDGRRLGGRGVWEQHYHLMAMALVHRRHGRLHEALALLESCGTSLAAAGVENPVFTAWWLHSAELLVRLDRPDDAAARVEFGRRQARRWPTSRSTGLSLLGAGVIATPDDRVHLLAESVRALADSPDRLYHALAELRLGRALYALGDKKGARTHLGIARKLAKAIGLLIVAERAHALHGVAGGRLERGGRAAQNLLSAAERPVAELAAAGATNRDIADSLFLTVRTVEYHLTSVYRKLGVAGRAGLAQRLAPMTADAAHPAHGGD